VKKTVLGGIALAAVTVLAFPAAAFAAPGDVPGTAALTGGTMSLVTPATLAFTATLNGADQTVSQPQALDVLDNTASAAGWNITLTSTQFAAAGGLALPNTAASDASAPTGACDVAAPTCTLASLSGVSYPVAIPADVAAPTAVKIQSAAAGSGMLAQTWTHTMQLAIPAAARAGNYSSTWTYSVVSGP
jgi:hypothetical protein